MSEASGIAISGLRIHATDDRREVLHGVDLTVGPGEFVGIAGETGSGKTTLGLSALGFARPGLSVTAGSVAVGDHQLIGAGREELRRLRGDVVGYVPQDPATALNPGLRVGAGLREVLRAHGIGDRDEQRRRIAAAFGAVGLPHDDAFLRRYPNQLSGGQQQRVSIATAFVLRPAVVVLDEPTTGLDAATKAAVVRLVHDLSRSAGASVLFISHDLRLLMETADRLIVVYRGAIVDDGPTARVAAEPRHEYTRTLLAAVPAPVGAALARHWPGPSPGDAATGPVLAVDALTARHAGVAVTSDVGFTVDAGECVALVGESGSGKTTIARTVAGLHTSYDGTVRLDGEVLARSVSRRNLTQLRALQYVFQNPFGSLNPRRTAGRSVALAAELVLGMSRPEAADAAAAALERVGLSTRHLRSQPHALSGGERQRVALARALICRPRILICDEVTSSLDLSVQAEIVQLLTGLQSDGLTMLFITHDLPLVSTIAQRTLVLRDGAVVEAGPTPDVLATPQHEYTRRLLTVTG
ncbi:ABC transporter ATP-binding protein [Jiangella endophytica]|uniref:ABC transporter ATP-binding protein n=1 Tax=Jiangella endophytica TaxID=1623398 RepID=UPI0018E526EA|nr:ABC transporter ATP-binding protein [Jiangella endophytica]